MTHPYHPQCGCATRRHMLGWAALASIGAITGLTGLTGCSQADNSSAQSLKPVEIDGATSCELDGMLLVDYPGPKGQIHYADAKEPAFFCDTMELLNTLIIPEVVRKVALRWGKADAHVTMLALEANARRRRLGRELARKATDFASITRAARRALRVWSGRGLVHAPARS